jgi:hypothetical protein
MKILLIIGLIYCLFSKEGLALLATIGISSYSDIATKYYKGSNLVKSETKPELNINKITMNEVKPVIIKEPIRIVGTPNQINAIRNVYLGTTMKVARVTSSISEVFRPISNVAKGTTMNVIRVIKNTAKNVGVIKYPINKIISGVNIIQAKIPEVTRGISLYTNMKVSRLNYAVSDIIKPIANTRDIIFINAGRTLRTAKNNIGYLKYPINKVITATDITSRTIGKRVSSIKSDFGLKLYDIEM